jgi:hypothetical protein
MIVSLKIFSKYFENFATFVLFMLSLSQGHRSKSMGSFAKWGRKKEKKEKFFVGFTT